MCPSTSFDTARARLVGPDEFPRFLVPDVGEALAGAGLGPDVELFVVNRGGVSRALVVRELALPHVAQGTMAGEPYLVSF